MSGGRCVAALVADTKLPRRWPEHSIDLLTTVAHHTWLLVENARLFHAERDRSEQLSVAISEVHHRVKNNLQSVAALLEMQIPDEGQAVPLEAVYDSLSQIKTIALVHDLLARDKPFGMVDVAQVLTNLARLLSAGMGTASRAAPIEVEAEPTEMATKTATALALAVNELLTNAAKHNNGLRNAITVRLTRDAGAVYVCVEDEGPGFAPGFDPNVHANIGINLVVTLIQHELQGVVRFMNRSDTSQGLPAHGARIEIAFPTTSLAE
jgi:two-component sensor histidine kinase